MVQLKGQVGNGQSLVHWPPFHSLRTGLVNHSLSPLLSGKSIKALRTIHLPLQLGNVAQVVQGEGIIRIKQVGLVEKRLCLFIIALANGLYAFTVELLHGSKL